VARRPARIAVLCVCTAVHPPAPHAIFFFSQFLLYTIINNNNKYNKRIAHKTPIHIS